jgi:phosphoribosyl-ATP pyrophosphohydrolase/phosphoribosyl-AMP cyclohydrolase
MILPSIDLRNGKVVQLQQGCTQVIERDDPLELAGEFDRFSEVAVVDLDAALGSGHNQDLVEKICARAECRVGGGIRSLEKAEAMFERGARKIIIGTSVFRDGKIDFPFLESLAVAFGPERLIFALDAIRGEIVTHGWQERTGLQQKDVIRELEPFAEEFLVTIVDKEGMMEGTTLEVYRDLRELTALPLTAAGGITALDEITALARLKINSQLGMALYMERLALSDCFSAALEWKNGLIPTITRDNRGQVLMLAYSSPESLCKIFSTGYVWHYSRSRKTLWKKGESSGNVLKFKKIRSDCDGDALLITAEPVGPACHTGRYSCFENQNFTLRDLYAVIQGRIKSQLPGSYTASLKPALLKAKILEEAREVMETETWEEVVWETADLIYFVSVWMAQKGVDWDDILQELARRNRKSGSVSNRRGKVQ